LEAAARVLVAQLFKIGRVRFTINETEVACRHDSPSQNLSGVLLRMSGRTSGLETSMGAWSPGSAPSGDLSSVIDPKSRDRAHPKLCFAAPRPVDVDMTKVLAHLEAHPCGPAHRPARAICLRLCVVSGNPVRIIHHFKSAAIRPVRI
jgi:hypothetical protein